MLELKALRSPEAEELPSTADASVRNGTLNSIGSKVTGLKPEAKCAEPAYKPWGQHQGKKLKEEKTTTTTSTTTTATTTNDDKSKEKTNLRRALRRNLSGAEAAEVAEAVVVRFGAVGAEALEERAVEPDHIRRGQALQIAERVESRGLRQTRLCLFVLWKVLFLQPQVKNLLCARVRRQTDGDSKTETPRGTTRPP